MRKLCFRTRPSLYNKLGLQASHFMLTKRETKKQLRRIYKQQRKKQNCEVRRYRIDGKNYLKF